MKPKRIFFVLISLLVIITPACLKEDTPSCSYSKNAKLKRIVACQYVETECPTRECDDIAWIEEEYEYDSKGRIERVLISPEYEDGVLTRMIGYHLYEYNSKDQLVKIEYYGAVTIDGVREYWLDKCHIFTYSDDGKKIKENIESVVLGNQYKLYKYTNNRLTRIENYEWNSDDLQYYILNEYNDRET